MSSLSSPPLKHSRMEGDNLFVPPQFHMPARPPISEFPDSSDVVVAKIRDGSRIVDGKTLLLNTSPTLELPNGTTAAFLAELKQHPACAKIREQLSGINNAYLDGIFGDEDAREDDTRRRVDYNAGAAALKSNSSKRLSMCVSCLTRGQHRHYRPWVINYMQTGVVPKETKEYPDMSIVLELVQREQAAYMRKFMEEIVSCEACKIEAGQRKRALKEGEGDKEALSSHLSCWNHNYMNERVERFARRWWRYKLESRLLRCLREAEAEDVREDDTRGKKPESGDNCGELLCKVFFDIKQSLLDIPNEERVRPAAVLTTRTRKFLANYIASVAPSELSEDAPLVTGISIPPTLPLALQQLDERAPQLHTAATGFAEQLDQADGNMVADVGVEREEEPPLVHPVSSLPDVSFSLLVCKSALVALATAHLSACREDFRLPVRCKWNQSEKRVDIRIDKPLPLCFETRRNINAAVMKRLVDSEPRFPSNSCCYLRGNRCRGKCCARVSFGPDFSFYCVSNCAYDVRNQNPVFRMVKMEYNCKGYNAVPDDEKTLYYERFSKREVVYMWILLQCNPTSILNVYRINAYSNCVIGIEQFSLASFTTRVLGSWSSNLEVQCTWNSLRNVLQSIVSAVVGWQRDLFLQQQEPVGKFTLFVAKEKENGKLLLCSSKALYPQQTVLLDEAVDTFIEPSSKTVSRREFLPPCVWPFSDRIPYTYGPAPKSCYLINRTTETRHPSEYYAKYDVLHHESHYYTVGDDGIIWERQPVG